MNNMLDVLKGLVDHESPSGDKAALDGLAATLAGRFRAIGGSVEVIDNPLGGNHVRARFEGSATLRPALVLGHFDTVWSLGRLAERPFAIEDGRAFGPGVYDMKASLVLAEFALRSLECPLPRAVVVLLTSDEEIGSPTSRRPIEDEAKKCAYVLVLEPPLAGGRLKTARKGVGLFTLTVEGRAAHAGVEPEKGISAIEELAHQIVSLNRLRKPEAGTTINVGLARGGTAPNVVAEEATATIDVRVASLDEGRRIEEAFQALQPILPGARLTVTGRFNRPPMERSPAVADLFERARMIGRSIGLELEEGSTGGGSDGNFTAALGVPTLDGLGVEGAGAHADHEQIRIDSLPERAALLAALLRDLRLENEDF